MIINDITIFTDIAAKFHRYLYIRGWAYHQHVAEFSIALLSEGILSADIRTGTFHAGVASLGPCLGYECHCILNSNDFPDDVQLIITFGASQSSIPLADLMYEARVIPKDKNLALRFNDILSKNRITTMLDVGGRDRSNYDRSKDFPGIDVTVLDILEGDNVDVVGDAHQLSDYFPEEYFDAVYSVSVFEHLLMPWKVVLELNKVMKVDAYGLVHTHQCIGMHDVPWDFWRYSDSAWKALFNKHTGFEIIATSLNELNFIIPFVYHDGKKFAERAAGYESSTVIFKKTNKATESWNVRLDEIDSTMYPKE